MKNSNFLKFTAFFLLISVLICSFTACNDDPEDKAPKKPETVEEILAEVDAAMKDTAFIMKKTSATKTTSESLFGAAFDKTETIELLMDGDNYRSSSDEDGVRTEQIYVDGIFYVHGAAEGIDFKNKIAITADQLEAFDSMEKEFESFSSIFQCASYTIDDNSDGNIVITGTELTDEGQAAIKGIYAAFFVEAGIAIDINYDNFSSISIIDPTTYKCIKQSTFVEISMSILSQTIVCEVTTDVEYSYEGDLTVTAPEDADEYTEKATFSELFDF